MSRRHLLITDPARDDLAEIRRYTEERYGTAQWQAYEAVLKRAILDIKDDPHRPGSRDRSEDLHAPSMRSYHISLSAKRAGGQVRSPRHLILYFEPNQDTVAVSRVLHDSRDLDRHLPEEHRREGRDFKADRNRARGEDKGRAR